VKIINGFPAGGTGRRDQPPVGDKIGGTAYSKNAAVVENKAGRGGRIACEVVKSAPGRLDAAADAVFLHRDLSAHLQTLSYDPFKDFVPVSMAAVMTHALAVGPLVPASVKTVKDYLAWAKANPTGPATARRRPVHAALPGALAGLQQRRRPEARAVRGSVAGVADMIGGQLASTSTPDRRRAGQPQGRQDPHPGHLRRAAHAVHARRATFAEQGFPSSPPRMVRLLRAGQTPPAASPTPMPPSTPREGQDP
jgi:hypothetical protein